VERRTWAERRSRVVVLGDEQLDEGVVEVACAGEALGGKILPRTKRRSRVRA